MLFLKFNNGHLSSLSLLDALTVEICWDSR
jgi:hypothetical protein